jgi:hypothetical protein
MVRGGNIINDGNGHITIQRPLLSRRSRVSKRNASREILPIFTRLSRDLHTLLLNSPSEEKPNNRKETRS